MNLFDPERKNKNMTTIHIKVLDPENVQVMVFLNTHGNAFKDFTTKMPIWRLPEWLNEWIDNPEFVCQRDFKYTGPQQTDTLPGGAKKVTLEQLGLMMAEDGY